MNDVTISQQHLSRENCAAACFGRDCIEMKAITKLLGAVSMSIVIDVSSDSDVFQPEKPRPSCRRRNHTDVGADEAASVPCRVVVAAEPVPVARQVFYFSRKMFDFMCLHGTADRIAQEAMRIASDRKGVLVKRKESKSRTSKLVQFTHDKGFEKPRGGELSELRRKRAARKRSTDFTMGRSKDSVKRTKYAASSDRSPTDGASQQPSSQADVASQANIASQQHSQTDLRKGKKRGRELYSKFPVPAFVADQEVASSCTDFVRLLQNSMRHLVTWKTTALAKHQASRHLKLAENKT